MAQCADEVTAALDSYRFDEAANRLYHFVWGTFCDWYLEFTKPILQSADAAGGAETRATTAWILGHILHLLHPIMPFVTEEIWEQLGNGAAGMLISAPWPDSDTGAFDPEAVEEMEWVVQAISAIRALRTEMNVPPSARLPFGLKDPEPVAAQRIERHREHFVRLARVEVLEPTEMPSSDGVPAVIEGATLVLGMGGVVDLPREKERLDREIRKMDVELTKIAAKLANPNFLAKAKPEVVDEQREREADMTRDRDRLKAAYDRLTVG